MPVQAPIRPERNSFRIAPWVRFALPAAAPVFAAGMAWLAWDIVQQRQAGRAWQDDWAFALILAALAAVVLLYAAGAALVLRARLELREDGFVLRGLVRTRTVPWTKVEGYRWVGGQMNVYLADREFPVNLSHFEQTGVLQRSFAARVPNLQAVERAREQDEIRANLELGYTDEQRKATLARLRRTVRALNWAAGAAAAIGGVNAVVFGRADVQLAAACVLAAVPVALILYALRHDGQVRIGYPEGTAYPDAIGGILLASLALGFIALLDPHTTLGEGFVRWTVSLTAALAGAWLYVDRARLREFARSYAGVVIVAAVLFLAAFWAGGSVYLINQGADASAPVWGVAQVTKLRKSQTKAGMTYYATVAPWSASPEPVEVDVPRATYEALAVGARVEIGVRDGALGIPWVAEVRPAPPG